MPSGVPITNTEFSENSVCFENIKIISNNNLLISVDYVKNAGAASNPLVIDYRWSRISSFCMKFMINLITLLQLKSVNNTQTFELTFINIKNPSSVSVSQFNISDPRVNPTSIRE